MVIATCQQGTLAASYASFELQRRARRAISAISNLSGDRGTLRPLDVSKENGPKFYKHLVLKNPSISEMKRNLVHKLLRVVGFYISGVCWKLPTGVGGGGCGCGI